MSPRPKHIPEGARTTSIALTEEDRAAVNWVRLARERRGENRKTLNDILVDALWLLLEKAEGMTREEIRAMIPPLPQAGTNKSKITEMPKHKGA